jgi:hypothetical protein
MKKVFSVTSLVLALLAIETANSQPPAEDATPGPVPRNAEGRVLFGGPLPSERGIWTPIFGIKDAVAPPETVPFQPWSRALWEERERHELEPHARCKASGASRQFLTPYGVEFLELPEIQQMYIFDIGGPHTFRTVYMDGRAHPEQFTPTNYGHSVGWWEGDTLIIDTIGYVEDFWFGRRGLPHTDKLHTIESFTRLNEGVIDYRITVDDPGAYTASYTGGFNLRWNPGQELFEYVCQQANYAAELMVGDGADSVDRSSSITP